MDPVLFNLLNAAGIALLLLLETRSRVFRRVFTDPKRMRRNLAFLASSAGVALLLHLAVGYLNPVLPKLAWQAPLWIQIPAVFAIAELFNWYRTGPSTRTRSSGASTASTTAMTSTRSG